MDSDVVLETLFERQLAKANHEQQKNANGIAQREAVPAAAEDDGGFSAFGAGDDDGGFSAFGNEDQDSASSSSAAPARVQSKEKPGIVKIRDSQGRVSCKMVFDKKACAILLGRAGNGGKGKTRSSIKNRSGALSVGVRYDITLTEYADGESDREGNLVRRHQSGLYLWRCSLIAHGIRMGST